MVRVPMVTLHIEAHQDDALCTELDSQIERLEARVAPGSDGPDRPRTGVWTRLSRFLARVADRV